MLDRSFEGANLPATRAPPSKTCGDDLVELLHRHPLSIEYTDRSIVDFR